MLDCLRVADYFITTKFSSINACLATIFSSRKLNNN